MAAIILSSQVGSQLDEELGWLVVGFGVVLSVSPSNV